MVLEWGLRNLQKRYERMYDSVGTIKQITESVREVINAREEKLSDAEVLELIEDFVLHDKMTGIILIKKKEIWFKEFSMLQEKNWVFYNHMQMMPM